MNRSIRATYKGNEVFLDHCLVVEEGSRNRCCAIVRNSRGEKDTVPIKKLKFLKLN